MAEEKAIETAVPPIAVEPTVETNLEDLEARNAELEAEKNRLIEEAANYRLAYLKETKKKKENFDDEESEDDKIRRISAETLANSRLAEITREQETIIKKALKENKELKLAVSNKTGVVASVGTHTESQAVTSTIITSDQLAAFKARGWTDKDIERYKKNMRRYAA